MHSKSISRSIGRLFSALMLASLLAASGALRDVSTVRAFDTIDLHITDLFANPDIAYANEDVRVWITVENIGNMAATAFHIDAYADRTPAGCSDPGDYFITVSGLGAGATQVFSITYRAGDLSNGPHNIYAFVDSQCAVTESNESNNQAGPDSVMVIPQPVAPPVHDDINAAKTMPGLPYWDSVNVVGATRAYDDPAVLGECLLDPGMASVWYQVTPAVDISLIIETTGSDYDTYIAVWTGTRGDLSLVTCNDDSGFGIKESMVRPDLTAGTQYYVEVAQVAVMKGFPYASLARIAGSGSDEVATTYIGGTLKFRVTAEDPSADFDGDGPSDIGYFRASTGTWGILQSSEYFAYGSPLFFSWGQTGDVATPGDFDGDKKWDFAFRTPPSGGQSAAYRILLSSTGYDYATTLTVPAGWPGLGDTPVVEDYNGDGISDPAIWRANAGVWIIPLSPSFTTYEFHSWGQSGDIPIKGDFDGDGRADLGYFRPSTGEWGFLLSIFNYSYAFPLFFSWGTSADIPVMADYDGDGWGDVAVVIPPAGGQSRAYRILPSSTWWDPATSITVPAGWPGLGDTPVPGDYDGDGIADPAIWRASTGVWIIPKSSWDNTAYMFASWGATGDQLAR